MSFRSSATNVRFGNLGIVSVGVIAFALATLQGCSPAAVTASSAREPGMVVSPLGALRADETGHAEPRVHEERSFATHAASRSWETRNVGFRPDVCRRCSAD